MSELPVSVNGRSAIDVARACALEGGRLALERFGGTHSVSVKGRGNVVTETDIEVERRIIATLRTEYPTHKVLSEETSPDTDASTGWTWVIDPIDGTKNYSQGIPFWCTTLALCRDGAPVVAVTYDAMHDACFEATEGGGAWWGEERLHASTRPDIASSVIGVDLGYDDVLGAAQISLIARIFPEVQTVRILGSAALAIAYVASVRLDAFTHMSVYPWDIAAGILLVRESGGAISGRSGEPAGIYTRAFIAGGRSVHDDFLRRYSSGQGTKPG